MLREQLEAMPVEDFIKLLNEAKIGGWAMRLTPGQMMDLMEVGAKVMLNSMNKAVVTNLEGRRTGYFFEAVAVNERLPNLKQTVYFK